MSYKNIVLGLLVLIMVFLIACAPREATSPQVTVPGLVKEVSEKLVPVKEAWEMEWEKTLQSARKEGQVVVYTSSVAPTLNELSPYFNKKFGIRIETVSGRGAELTAKLFSERRAGLYLADVILTGMNNALNETIPGGATDPLESSLLLPEVLDSKAWYEGKLTWGDDEHRVFMSFAYPNTNLAINTELVKKGEIKSYYDLLNPKWKGKLIMNDPTVTGTGLKSFSVLGWALLNLDFFRQLARQEPMIIRDQRLQVAWLAQGKYHILAFPRTPPMTEFMKAGAPIAYVAAKEGTYISVGGGNISLVNRAPHPKAARVLINWFLSREGQTLITKSQGLQSARIDVPTDFLDPSKVRTPGMYYFTKADTKEWLSRDPEYKKMAEEIFGYLLR